MTKSAARTVGSEVGREIVRGILGSILGKRALSDASYRRWGIAFAVFGVLAFSLRPILIKLSYAAHPVSPNTLLFLRMALSLPFFLAIGWWLRDEQPRLNAPRLGGGRRPGLPRLLRARASSTSSGCSTSAPASAG